MGGKYHQTGHWFQHSWTEMLLHVPSNLGVIQVIPSQYIVRRVQCSSENS